MLPRGYAKTLGEIKQRQKEVSASLAKKAAPTAKTVKLEWIVLDQNVADDPRLKAEVLKIDPSYSGSH